MNCKRIFAALGRKTAGLLCLASLLLALPASAQIVTYVHTDALGSVVAKTDESGNVIERYNYEPYGAVVGGQVKDGPGYTGHVSDAYTGLSYMQQRYMDPQLGVFLSVDPVTGYDNNGRSFNRYRYAANSPYRFNDPDGRQERAAERHNDSVASDPAAYDTFGPAALAVTYALVRATPLVGPVAASAMTGAIDSAPQPRTAAETTTKASSTTKPLSSSSSTPSPNFVVSSNGTAFPVPPGSTGPTPVVNSAGNQTGVAFTGGKGGENGQVATMRIMDPTSPKGASPGYPGGYIKYEKANRQGVDPSSGKTLPNAKSHFPIK